MGISRDSTHKRRATGGKLIAIRKKRKFELGRQAAMTKIGERRVHHVRVRGGHTKQRALRLEQGNFSWGSEVCTRKTRILDVVYNASNNELVRTKTLVKGAIVVIDAAPFRQWYEKHYGLALGKKKRTGATPAAAETPAATGIDKAEVNKVSRKVHALHLARRKARKVEPALEELFATGRLYASLSSRPGQSGRADGYILEGDELQFYVRKMKGRKSGKQ
eukprot:TRINITY_DN5859_c0_g1_i1.p1 TRINITY_DN5859_c0_g1~~TRINITY_DN5859_c0_g1_i1.p1  ORF type:complete len:220 (+),score=45.41 TRINITY_DN5859_c0_g1_i1:166-825(+)